MVSPRSLREFSVAWVMAMIVFSVLWRGGKSIDVTWLLLGVSWLCSLQYWLNKPERKTHLSLPLWCMIHAFTLWTLLSFLQSTTMNYGLDEVFRTAASAFLCLWIGRAVVEEGIDAKAGKNDVMMTVTQKILLFTAYATVLSCFIGVVVYALQPVDRFVGTFFDWRFHTDYWPNAWAQYVLLTWPVVAWWSSQLPGRLKHRSRVIDIVVPALVLGFVLGCFALSYSRGAYIAFIGQALLWAMYMAFAHKPDPVALKSIALRVLATIAVALVMYGGLNAVRQGLHPVQSMREKVTFNAAEGTSSVSERRQFWSQASILAKVKPVLGWGPYSFRFVQPRLQLGVRETSDHPHNVFLKLASERGYVAALVFGIIVVWIVAIGVRTKINKPKALLQDADVIPVLIIAVAGVMAHNLIDYNLQFVGIAMPFWLFLGMLSVFVYSQKGTSLSRIMIIGSEMILLTLLLCWAIFEGRYLVLSSVGRAAEARGNDSQALVWYAQAADQTFSRDMHLSRARIFLDQRRASHALYVLDQYAKQNIEDARMWKLKGDACKQIQDFVCALTAYEIAYDYNRYNDLWAVHEYVSMLAFLDRHPEIDARRREFESLMNEYALAIEGNEHFISLSDAPEALIALADLFAELYPEQEPQYVVLGARVLHKAQQDRSEISARQPGHLW